MRSKYIPVRAIVRSDWEPAALRSLSLNGVVEDWRTVITMKRSVYYRGVPGKKFGIWNGMAKCFQFNICEDTPMLAEARLYQKIGDDARKYRFEPRMLPDPKPKPPGTVSDQAKRALEQMGRNAHGGQGNGNSRPVRYVFDEDIAELPTVDTVKEVHGEWVWKDLNGDGSLVLCCSVCLGTDGARETAHFCSECGAKMDGGADRGKA